MEPSSRNSMSAKTASITNESSFQDVDDALYAFESPYYSSAARGFPFIHHFDRAWFNERDRLTVLWLRKCPWGKNKQPLPKPSLFARIAVWFKA
jgi:hypothetical protein